MHNRERRSRVLPLVLGISLAATVALPEARAQTALAPLADGDRWAALGDGLTQDGTYHEWVWLFHLTRFPRRDITVYNAGMAADRPAAAVSRLSWDVLPQRPTLVSVLFTAERSAGPLAGGFASGAGGPAAPAAGVDAYRDGMRSLVDALSAPATRVVLFTPPPGETAGTGDAAARAAEAILQLGRERNVPVIDLHGPMSRILSERKAADANFTFLGPDHVQPGPPAQLLIAYLMLRAQAVPAEVSTLGIDLTTDRFAQKNGTVTSIVPEPDQVTFNWSEEALPFPVDAAMVPTLEWVPFTQDLNREILQIIGLRAGRWELRIDEERIGVFTAEQFAQGLNLAAMANTPQMRQAFDVLKVANERTALVQENLRLVAAIEHQLAPDSGHPVTLEQMRPLVEKRIQELAGDPAAAETVRLLKQYPEKKARVVEVIATATRLAELAREIAQPRPHVYLVRRMR